MIQPVDAPDDPRIASYARVGDHGWLTEAGLFVAEGRLVVERLIDSHCDAIQSVLATPAAVGALGPRLGRVAADIYVADRELLHAVTGFNFHRGCLALARRMPSPPLARFLEARRVLVLEAIANPDNMGGLFRAAAAFGADAILLDTRSADPFYRKAIRTSMGAVLRVPFARLDGWPAGVTRLRNHGFRVLALTPERSASVLADVAATTAAGRVALLLGTEGAGLSADALACVDERVRIPIAPDVDSLNVVVAAAIALYALG